MNIVRLEKQQLMAEFRETVLNLNTLTLILVLSKTFMNGAHCVNKRGIV
jgi:hypothetical protein